VTSLFWGLQTPSLTWFNRVVRSICIRLYRNIIKERWW